MISSTGLVSKEDDAAASIKVYIQPRPLILSHLISSRSHLVALETCTNTMKEAFVNTEAKVEVRDSPIPKPAPGQILIQVVVSGTNPKDWKLPKWIPGEPANTGDDIAGYVAAVGEGVKGFAKGDKVAAFHEMMTPHGSFAEYGIAWDYSTFHLPDATSFEGEPSFVVRKCDLADVVSQRPPLSLSLQ